MEVQYGEQKKSLPLVIVAGNGPTLLGRNWLQHIQLDLTEMGIRAVKHSSPAESLEAIKKRYESSVFSEGLGLITPFKGNMILKSDVQPKFYKPRPVPFSIKEAVGEELDRLESEGIIERVNHSEWAAPIVAVPKKMGSFVFVGIIK